MKKKILSLCIAAAVFTGIINITAFAEEKVLIFADDYSSYEPAGRINGAGSSAADNVWVISDVFSDGGAAGSEITEDAEGEKALRLFSSGQAALNLNPDVYSDLGDNVEFKVSLTKETPNIDAGIRFMVQEDENSYYQLRTAWAGDAFYFQKITDGTTEKSVYIPLENNAGIRYDMTIQNYGTTISYSVTDTVNNITRTGKYTDTSMFAARGANAKYQFASSYGGATVYDNFELGCIAFEALVENFDSYSDAERKNGAGSTVTKSVFKVSDVHSGDNAGGSSISSLTDSDKILTLYGGAENTETALNLHSKKYEGISTNAEIKVSLKLNDILNGSAGIRFMVQNDENSYYELGITAETGEFVLEKVADGETVMAEGTNVYGEAEKWYIISLASYKNSVIWSITDVENNNVARGVSEDTEMFSAIGADAKYQLFVTDEQSADFNDFNMYESVALYKNLVEDETVLYTDVLTEADKNDDDSEYMVYKLKEAADIRRFVLTADEVSFPDGVKVYLANSDDLSDRILIGESAGADTNTWNLYNFVTVEEYKYICIEGGGVKDACAFEKSGYNLNLVKGDMLPVLIKLENDWDISWNSENPDIAEVKDGKICVYEKGNVALTAENTSGSIMSIYLDIIGELENAESTDSLDEYIEEKRDVIEDINKAIKNEDKGEMIDILCTRISKFKDFNHWAVAELSDDEISDMADRLLDYEPFETGGNITKSDLYELLDALNTELAVALISNVSDADEIESLLSQYKDLYGVDLENKYYLDNTEETFDAMLDKSYTSADDVNNTFKEGYTWAAFVKNDNSLKFRDIVEDNSDAIGYNEKSYDKIKDKGELFDQIARKKSTIDDIDDLKDFIDDYKEKSSGGSSGGGGGSSSKSSNKSSSPLIGGTPVQITDAGKQEPEEQSPYTDLAVSHWAYKSIVVLSANKIINGYGDGKFGPENTVTRAEFAKMLVNAFEIEESEEIAEFSDLDENAWYYKYIQAMSNAGIIKGTDGKCMPENPITREEMAVMIYRTLVLKESLGEENTVVYEFSDEAEIAEWAFSSVKQLQARNIINGMQDGSFSPGTTVTRAQAAKIIYNSTNN